MEKSFQISDFRLRMCKITIKMLLMMIFMTSGGPGIYPQIAVIDLKGKAVISNEEITLNNIANISSDDPDFLKELNTLKIGFAPKNTRKKCITKYEIIRLLRQNNIDIRDIRFRGYDSTAVMKPSVVITYSDIYDKAKKFLLKKYGWEKENVNIRMHNNLSDIILPKGDTLFQFSCMPNGRFTGYLQLSLNLKQNNRILRSLRLSFNIQLFDKIWVANRQINKGELIRPEDICLEKNDITRLNLTKILNKDEIAGKIALRNIRKGAFLTERMIGRKMLVKRGQFVTVVVNNALLNITINGKAKDNGYLGDIIRVQNMDSGNIISGIVKDSNTIIVR